MIIKSVTSVTIPINPDPFPFYWLVDERGYEWVRGLTSEPRLASSVSADPYDRLRIYEPLKDDRLFLKFAALKPSRAEIQRFARRYGLLFDRYSIASAVRRPAGSYRVTQLHGTSLKGWKGEIERLRVLVRVWKAVKSARKDELKKVILWKNRNTLDYKLGFSDTLLASSCYNRALLERFRPFDVIQPAMYLLQAEINKRIAEASNSDYLAIVPRLVWCSGPRINGIAKPDHHQRLVFQPTNLLAAIWLQFARAVTSGYQLKVCEGCGEYFQVGKGARRVHTKTCSVKCRKRASRNRSQGG
jgi:hypothetical protein